MGLYMRWNQLARVCLERAVLSNPLRLWSAEASLRKDLRLLVAFRGRQLSTLNTNAFGDRAGLQCFDESIEQRESKSTSERCQSASRSRAEFPSNVGQFDKF